MEIEKEIEELKENIESINSKAGNVTTNIYHAEGGGQSSVALERNFKGETKSTVKIYSGDMDKQKIEDMYVLAVDALGKIPDPQPKENGNYKKAYVILMDHFDDIPEDERPKVHKKLEKLGL